MEESITTSETPETYCPACSVPVIAGDAFCNHCAYPLQGSEEEQKRFFAARQAKEIDLDEANRKIRRAGYALYIIAAFTVVAGLAIYTTDKSGLSKNVLLITNLILAAMYAGLGVWSRSKPLAAIISGISLYALVFILNAVTNPLSIISGIIFKIFIIVFFIRGIKSAIEAEKLKKELNV